METLTAIPCRVCESRAYVGHEDVTVGDEPYRVCDVCLADNSGPGKFEGNHSDYELALALVLYALVLDGDMGDHSLIDESESAYQFGNLILVQDSQGFTDVREFSDAAAATREMDGWEDDGMGAHEDDGWISYESNGIHASLSGTHLGTFTRLSRAKAAISLEMRKTGYYPNVFLSGEHGPTVRRIDVW